MTSKSIYVFVPTYLYIKQHSITGKLYFGKTIQDPLEYNGSGKLWKLHIAKHGKEHVETLWFCLFYTKESIQEFALNFSKQENIVESNQWLNLKDEDGLHGGNLTSEIKNRISESLRGNTIHLGYKNSIESRQLMSIKAMNRKVHPRIGLTHSNESKIKMSESKIGKPLSSKTKESMSKTLSSLQIKVTCPYCNKIGKLSGMRVWHMDNCKFKVQS